jgi:GxxExxY protein
MQINEITERIIGAAIAVHRELGPGLLESAYQAATSYELDKAGLCFERQRNVPVIYKGIALDCSYRLDLVVEGTVIVEIKVVDKLAPVHAAQLLTYLRITGCGVGLLINFNVPQLRDGIRRVVLGSVPSVSP